MNPSTPLRTARRTFGAFLCVLVLLTTACDPSPPNGSDASSDGPLDPDAALDGDADASSTADADAAAPLDASGDAGSPSCGACPTGAKWCDGRCVSIDDPQYGCGEHECAIPCMVPTTFDPKVSIVEARCVGGRCAVKTCRAGLGDCDGNFANGCETDLGSPSACGSCGTTCAPNQVCDGNVCTSTCTFPRTNCQGACKDLSTSPNDCGGCGARCPGRFDTLTCTNGVCGVTCTNGRSCPTNGLCFDATSDPTHCGSSCQYCPVPANGRALCVQSACTIECLGGSTKCGSVCLSTYADDANCGGCGIACGGGKTCVGGSCVANGTLAITQAQTPEDIIVDGGHVYFTDIGLNNVVQLDKTTLQTVVLGSGQAKPYRLAVDATYVYWSSYLGGAILRAPIGGGQAPQVVYSAAQPTAVAVDGTNLYWSAAGGIYRAPKGGGGSVTPLSPYQADSFVSSTTALFFPTIGGATPPNIGVEKSGGAIVHVDAHSHFKTAPVLIEDELHCVHSNGVSNMCFHEVFGVGEPAPWTTARGPASSFLTAPNAIASNGCLIGLSMQNTTSTVGIVSRGTNVYLALSKSPKPGRLALDSTHLYWADQSGFIGRVKLP